MPRTVVVPNAFLTAVLLWLSHFSAYNIRDFLSAMVTTKPFPMPHEVFFRRIILF
jgi:hypothetical protein